MSRIEHIDKPVIAHSPGDIITLPGDYKRRSFWEWLTRKPRVLKKYIVHPGTFSLEPGAVNWLYELEESEQEKTMNKLERIEQMEADLAKLKAEVEAEAAIEGVPEYGQRYWWIDVDGGFTRTKWENDWCDQKCYELGNVFLTQEAAEQELERRLITAELKRMTKGFVPDWKDENQNKFHLWYDHFMKRWNIGRTGFGQRQGAIYFASQEDAEAARDSLGKRLDVLKDG